MEKLFFRDTLIHITILSNYEDNFDPPTTTTDESMGFEINAMFYPILTNANKC